MKQKINELETKLKIRILRLGKLSDCNWFDFVEVPQGYIRMCGTGVPRPKGMRKNPNVVSGNCLIDPTDEQIINHAKHLMKYSSKNPDDCEFEITSKDFRKENKK